MMPPERDRHGIVAAIPEPWHEMLFPAPRPLPEAVHEQDGRHLDPDYIRCRDRVRSALLDLNLEATIRRHDLHITRLDPDAPVDAGRHYRAFEDQLLETPLLSFAPHADDNAARAAPNSLASRRLEAAGDQLTDAIRDDVGRRFGRGPDHRFGGGGRHARRPGWLRFAQP